MLKFISKFLFVSGVMILCLSSCNQQEEVNPAIEIEEESGPAKLLIQTFVYKGQAYPRREWKKEYKHLETKSFVLIEDETAYLFDSAQEADNYDKVNQQRSRLGGIPWAIGGSMANWNPSANVSLSTISRYYQCKVRFYEHAHYRGRWIQYRVRGVIEKNWHGGHINNKYYNRFAPEWSNIVSSVVVDEVVVPRTRRRVSGLFGALRYEETGPGHIKVHFFNNRHWRSRGSKPPAGPYGWNSNARAWRAFNATGIGPTVRKKYANPTVNFKASGGGTDKVYNDQIGSFMVEAYDYAGGGRN